MKFCWHKYTKWEQPEGIKFSLDFHGMYHENVPILKSKVCVRCGRVKWRVAK